MLKETYFYLDTEDKTEYYFQSEGPQGKIIKKVIFSPMDEDLWNLAFGDLHNGDIDDSIISNNNDIVKILATIVKIAYEFSAEFPTRSIHIKPVDKKRKQLYNNVFRRNFEIISQTFHIIGTSNDIDEGYSSEKFYDIFKLKRKFVQ